jgi:hypothetical protein
MGTFMQKLLAVLTLGAGLSGCGERPGGEGGKVFLALGICLAAVFLVCYIVIKGREKD